MFSSSNCIVVVAYSAICCGDGCRCFQCCCCQLGHLSCRPARRSSRWCQVRCWQLMQQLTLIMDCFPFLRLLNAAEFLFWFSFSCYCFLLNSIWWKVSALLKRLLHCQLLDWKRKKEKQIKQCVQSSVCKALDQKENILKASIFFLCLLSTTENSMHKTIFYFWNHGDQISMALAIKYPRYFVREAYGSRILQLKKTVIVA